MKLRSEEHVQLQGLLERCKLGQEKLDDVYGSVKEAQVRLKADQLLREVLGP